MQKKLLGIIRVNFVVAEQLVIRYSVFISYWRKNGSIMGMYKNSLQILRPMTREGITVQYSH
jgi:hypothetical protein